MLISQRCEFFKFKENAEMAFIFPEIFYSYVVYVHMFINICYAINPNLKTVKLKNI